MELEYHWDADLYAALLNYRAVQLLRAAARIKEREMGSPADIQNLVKRMQRAGTLTDRAAASGSKGDTIMNSFEQTLNRFDDHMGKVADYDKTLAAMLAATGDNGGPALEATFSPAAAQPAPSVSPAVAPAVHHDTGDPIKT